MGQDFHSDPPDDRQGSQAEVEAAREEAAVAAAEPPKRAYNPAQHLMNLPGKGGNTDYLEVKHRVAWFRSAYPQGGILTDLRERRVVTYRKKVRDSYIEVTTEEAVFYARVWTNEGGEATGWATETRDDFPDFLEKAETKAIGRALAALGFGTTQARDFDLVDQDGYEHPPDSPERSFVARGQQRDPAWEKRRGEATAAMRQQTEASREQPASEAQQKFARALIAQSGMKDTEAVAFLKQQVGRQAKLAEMTKAEIGKVINALQDRKHKPAEEQVREDGKGL